MTETQIQQLNLSGRLSYGVKSYLTRYHPRFVRSLVYMLQASEYHIEDYLAWVGRTKDFRFVEKRKHLVLTHKALVLLVSAWALVAITILVVFFGFTGGDEIANLFAIAALLAFPYVLPCVLLLPLFIIEAVQLPVEEFLIAQAKMKLKKHRGLKIAIAGSYGKTSMREMLKAVLAEGKSVAAPGGSENTPIGIARFINRLKGDEEVLIFELGEYYPGDIKKLCAMVQPDLGIITGVNEAHLSKFKTIESAANTIFELADFLGDKPVYINGDDDRAKIKGNAFYLKGVTFYSRQGVDEWKVVAAETSLDGTSFTLEKQNVRINAQSKLLGLHHVGPIAAAAHVGLRLGLSVAQVEQGISKTTSFAHRLERRDDPSGVITLDDSYNGNPDGAAAVIAFLSAIEDRKRWYVTPGLVEMGERSEEIHKAIGKQLAEANIEKVVLIKNSVTPWIEKGLQENGYKGEVLWFDNALDCYNSLPHMTVAGDVVLLQNDWPDQYA